jgi:excisionase family DNA binding protein
MESRWLSIEEACKYGKMSRNKLLGFVRNGEIHGTKRTGRWRIDRESIDSFFLEEDLQEGRIYVDLKRRAGIRCV